MKSPLVSIITPCYNAEKYVSKLLDSILIQDYDAIEFIVIDDGSTDKTRYILNDYKQKFKKNNIAYKIITKSNGGAASAVNHGLKVFTGEYLTFIDADDFLNASSVKKRVEFLERDQSYDIVYSATDVVDERDYTNVLTTKAEVHSPPRHNLFIDMIKENNYIWTHAYLVRSSYFLSMNPKRHIQEFEAGQNIQLFLPLWYRGKVGYIEESLVTIVNHQDSHSRIKRNELESSKRRLEIERIYLDTLDRIDMPIDEREACKAIVKEKYRKQEKRVFQKINSSKDELGQLYDYDEQKFRNNYVSNIEKASQSQLAAKLVFSTHSLEKSLSNDNFEVGHGFRVSRKLVDMLNIYKKKNYDFNHLAYINTLSVLKVFYDRHKETKFTEELQGIFGDFNEDIQNCKSDLGGSDKIYFTSKQDNHTKNFKELAEGRYAVRMYSDKPVDKNDIVDAVQIAMKSPTVCNRQSIHVHTMYDSKIIEAVLKVQGGIAHYDTPPVLLLVTADDSGYVDINERNQGFIDGGLFAMSLLYAFEYKKLAACPLHAMFKEVPEKTIRGMLDIPDSEKLITFISVGHFNEVNNICKSFRYSANHVITEKTKIHDFIIETPAKLPSIELKDSSKVDSLMLAARKKVRIRTRLRNLKRTIRIRTRIRESIKKYRLLKMEKLQKSIVDNPQGAILTLTGYFNYGNMLQRYALQRFLQKKGYRFISYAQESYDTGGSAYDDLRNTIRFVETRIARKEVGEKDKFSSYIVGSDQVWRMWNGQQDNDSYASLRYYFFDFLKDRDVKRIAYAASFGHSSAESSGLSNEFVESVQPLVDKIDAISMREDRGVEMAKELWDVKAEQTVDPTMLLTTRDYNLLIKSCPQELKTSPQIFAYILGSINERGKHLESILNAYGKKTHSAIYLKQTKNQPSVEQWLKDIRDAELVVTDSFHGIVFSIINNTPFIALINSAGGASRIETLLTRLGLNDRILKDGDIKTFSSAAMPSINWQYVNRELKKMRNHSAEWLIKAVKE